MDLIKECSLLYNFAKHLQLSCHKIPERVFLKKFSRDGIGKKQEAKHHKTEVLICHVLSM